MSGCRSQGHLDKVIFMLIYDKVLEAYTRNFSENISQLCLIDSHKPPIV
jgi:hypothetical protein